MNKTELTLDFQSINNIPALTGLSWWLSTGLLQLFDKLAHFESLIFSLKTDGGMGFSFGFKAAEFDLMVFERHKVV